ncbi:MAG: ABC transporter ATP-binding protein [Elsteraceae bacterium]
MSAPLLTVENLTKIYVSRGGFFGKARKARVVDDVSFTVGRGEVFGIVGESGSGKSTIGRLALRLIEADEGRIVFDGQDVRALDAGSLRKLRRRMQIIFQDPFSSLDPRARIGDALAEPIRLHRLRKGAEVGARVAELLTLVGLAPEAAGRYPHEFSGGQRQRIAIARALAVEPDLIICDEPVSALDLSIQAQVVNLLADLRARTGVSYLFISHDMAVVRHLATSVAVLYSGRIVEMGPAARIFADPRHPYTRMLLEASPIAVPREIAVRKPVTGEPPSPYDALPGCRFASRCPHAVDPCRDATPGLSIFDDGGRQAACVRAADLPPATLASDDESLMSDAYRRRLTLLREAAVRRPG